MHTSAKNKRRLCDLSGKRHRVFSSVASVASVLPLCRLCGKKALCTFLNEISLFFIEESTHCLFSTEATQRHHRGHRGQRGENAMAFSREVTEAPLFFC